MLMPNMDDFSPPVDENRPVAKKSAALPGVENDDYKVYSARWWILAQFSTLAMFNNFICFSFAPIVHLARDRYGMQYFSVLVSMYFMSYIIVSFPGSWLISSRGLRFGVVLGAWLQALGAALRWIAEFVPVPPGAYYHHFTLMFLGQLLAALAQPFLVNPPSQLAAAWFPENERTTATTIACNANLAGIAVAYMIAPWAVSEASDFPWYLFGIAAACVACALTCTFYFPEGPPSPPSRSSSMKIEETTVPGEGSLPYRLYQQCSQMAATPGLGHTVLAFGVAEAALNALSTFMNDLLTPYGFDKAMICFMGTSFIGSSLVGSAVVGFLVDRSGGRYVAFLVAVLLAATAMVVWFMFAINITAVSAQVQVSMAVVGLGFFLGPIQPIAMELAMEVSFPMPEANIVAVQQVLGNLFSAAALPLMVSLRNPITHAKGNALWLLATSLFLVAASFGTFKGAFVRTASAVHNREQYEKL